MPVPLPPTTLRQPLQLSCCSCCCCYYRSCYIIGITIERIGTRMLTQVCAHIDGECGHQSNQLNAFNQWSYLAIHRQDSQGGPLLKNPQTRCSTNMTATKQLVLLVPHSFSDQFRLADTSGVNDTSRSHSNKRSSATHVCLMKSRTSLQVCACACTLSLV